MLTSARLALLGLLLAALAWSAPLAMLWDDASQRGTSFLGSALLGLRLDGSGALPWHDNYGGG